MAKFLWIVPALLLNSFLLAEEPKPAEDVKDKSPWTIEAVPAATTVRPGQDLEIKVRIVNTADVKNTVYIRRIAWNAQGDNPNVTFVSTWPKRAGKGPVVTWHPVEVGSKEAYSHSWTCKVSGNAPAGELAFKVGVPLSLRERGIGETVFWSEPVKVTVKTPGS